MNMDYFLKYLKKYSIKSNKEIVLELGEYRVLFLPALTNPEHKIFEYNSKCKGKTKKGEYINTDQYIPI